MDVQFGLGERDENGFRYGIGCHAAELLYRKLRAAGVDPRGQPVGADIGRGIGKLADQNRSGQIVKAIVILVGVVGKSFPGAAIRKQNIFDRSVRGHRLRQKHDRWGRSRKRRRWCAWGRTANSGRPDSMPKRKSIAGLAGQMAVEIFRGVKRVVRLRRHRRPDRRRRVASAPSHGRASPPSASGCTLRFATAARRRFPACSSRICRPRPCNFAAGNRKEIFRSDRDRDSDCGAPSGEFSRASPDGSVTWWLRKSRLALKNPRISGGSVSTALVATSRSALGAPCTRRRREHKCGNDRDNGRCTGGCIPRGRDLLCEASICDCSQTLPAGYRACCSRKSRSQDRRHSQTKKRAQFTIGHAWQHLMQRASTPVDEHLLGRCPPEGAALHTQSVRHAFANFRLRRTSARL